MPTLPTTTSIVSVGASMRRKQAELDARRVGVNARSRDRRRDPLTGVADRRAFDDAVRRMTGEIDAVGGRLCLVLVDVDGFAAFNATHGTALADQVLRCIAQEMDQCVRGRDLLARYHGAGFAILLPGTAYHAALVLAESLRAIIEAQVVETGGGPEIDDLTISLGVARCRPGEDGESFVGRAVACLHQSKADGRNRVTGERDLRG